MDINLKLKHETFLKIKTGEQTFIRHGFSKNKKYARLFSGLFSEITLFSEGTKETCIVKFKSIETMLIDEKWIFQINFK
jgi:hypothetical protein